MFVIFKLYEIINNIILYKITKENTYNIIFKHYRQTFLVSHSFIWICRISGNFCWQQKHKRVHGIDYCECTTAWEIDHCRHRIDTFTLPFRLSRANLMLVSFYMWTERMLTRRVFQVTFHIYAVDTIFRRHTSLLA